MDYSDILTYKHMNQPLVSIPIVILKIKSMLATRKWKEKSIVPTDERKEFVNKSIE